MRRRTIQRSDALVDPPSRIDVPVGRARKIYRVWLGNGQILAIDCPVTFRFEPGLVLQWRTFWRAGTEQQQGRIARQVVREAGKIFGRSASA